MKRLHSQKLLFYYINNQAIILFLIKIINVQFVNFTLHAKPIKTQIFNKCYLAKLFQANIYFIKWTSKVRFQMIFDSDLGKVRETGNATQDSLLNDCHVQRIDCISYNGDDSCDTVK